ncbi:MAG: hypothetical protein OJF50_000415 [Nitrospira sp.]|jgi:hypothetical protein|nr:hypothetical protein [Nitrospira sp.]
MASIILGMGFGWCSLSQAQMGGMGGGMGGGMPTVPGTAFGGATDPSSMQAVNGLRLIPSVQISERYDSNVFFASKSQLQGISPEDVVTTVVPQVRGLYADGEKLVKINAAVGAVGSYYANNTGLSYVGVNAGAGLDMSDLVSRWRPGAKWTVSEMYFHSPQPPAFLQGGPRGEQANPLVAGFQATRTNTSSNSVSTTFELPLSKTVNLTGSYTNSFIRYGASKVPRAGTLITQNRQGYTAGLAVQTSIHDTVTVDFTGSEFDQGSFGTFSARGGTIGWTHAFSPAVSINAVGGAQMLSGESNGVQFSVIAPLGSLALSWNDPTTSMALAYRSGITPSFQFQGGAMLNHTVSFNMTQKTPIRDLTGLLGANYSVANEYGSNSGGGAFSWTTVGGTAGLLYPVTQKMFLTLTYNYQNVDRVFSGEHFAYDKHVVQLSLAQAFY